MGRLLSWNEGYSVGIQEIDDQHKRIIGMINGLYKAIEKGAAENTINKTLHALVDYTQTHFLFEERLLREAGYPDYADHVAMHENLVLKVAELAEMNKNDSHARLGNTLITFLYDWLTHHILHNDMDYAPHVIQANRSASSHS